MAKQTGLEQRLRELERLRSKGTITEEEYQTRRATILSDTSAPVVVKGGRSPLKLGCLGLVALMLVGVMVAALVSGGDDDASSDSSAAVAVGTNRGDVHVPLAAGSSGEIAPERNDTKRSRVTINDIRDPAASSNQFSQPPAGKRYWAVHVTVENVGTAEVTSVDWKLRDSKDNELNRTFVSGVGENLEIAYNLTPGGKTSGFVVFELEQDAQPKWLRADPNPFLKNDLYFDVAQ